MRLNDDRHPDLFVTNEPERVDGLPSTNRLYENVAGTRFRSVPEAGADLSLGGSCAVAADLDGDGDDDLLVCATESWRGRPPGLRAFRNDNGTLREATGEFGLPTAFEYEAIAADLDADGDVEVVQVSAGRLRISHRHGADFDVVREIGLGSIASIAAGDANGDGALDILAARGGSPNRADVLLLNTGDGTSFRSVTMPGRANGVADEVIRIDHDRNGLDDFAVLNGFFSSGPIQLYAFFPER